MRGYATALAAYLPHAERVLDPLPVVRLGLADLEDVRLRGQQEQTGHRARAERLITDLRGCPIPELARLGRTLHGWRRELRAHFDHPATSNEPTENSTSRA